METDDVRLAERQRVYNDYLRSQAEAVAKAAVDARGRTILWLVILSVAGCFAWAVLRPGAPVARAATGTIDKAPAMQLARGKLIDDMIRLDLFTKTGRNGSDMPRAWVTAQFRTLDVQQKEQALQVVYGYYLDGAEHDSLAIIDSLNGQEIGRYRPGSLTVN